MSERPTFSPHWHRVRVTRPRLRPHVQVTRQRYRGRRWHVAHDPASNKFYRMSPVANELVGLLDGKRTVEDAWTIVAEKHGADAPTQPEVIELISQLYQSNLLSVDASPETEQLLKRGRDRLKKKVQSQAIGIMYFRMKLFNPDGILSAVEPVLRPILNRWGFFVWLAFVAFALYKLIPELGTFAEGFRDAIAPSNWLWIIAVFVVAKALHELGHGVICKRFGGQVPEFGALLLVLVPSPYVDASASWAFASKWQRMAVGTGGMIFELFLAAIAVHVWLATSPGELPHQLAYNAMLTAGISTLIFNANPLMRFDGYYILSDLLEIPNLMNRSFKMLQFQFQKFVYRLDDAKAPTSDPGEGLTLTIYGIAATVYRVFLFISITLFVMGQLFAIGLLLAIWTAAAWFLMPVGKFLRWLSSSPKLAEHRVRAVGISLAMLAIGVVLLGLIPVQDSRRGVGVVESSARTGVFALQGGFLDEVIVQPGSRVREGDPIIVLRNDELEHRLRMARAMLAEFESVEREMTATSPSSVVIARDRVAAQRDAVAFLKSQVERLTVRAPHEGVLVGPELGGMIGGLVSEGDSLGEIVNIDDIRVAASLPQLESAWLFDDDEPYRVAIRPVSLPSVVVRGEHAVAIDAGQQILPHAGLGAAGGGTVAVDQQDRSGRLTQRAQFVVYVEPEASDRWIPTPGERVHLRFRLSSKPLMAQWADRLHKLIQGRVQL
ncbi:MAG: PqqD family peptide modification chaperone [Planctomycetota bacterium]